MFWRSLFANYAYYSTRTISLINVVQCVTVLNVNHQRSKLQDRSKTQHLTLR